jgi:hypothetical protein
VFSRERRALERLTQRDRSKRLSAWVVKSGHATAYLFGRKPVHVVDPWLSAGIQEVFDDSDELLIDGPRAEPRRQIQLVSELGAADGVPYFERTGTRVHER